MRTFVLALSVILWLLLGWFLLQSNKECCHGTEDTGAAVSQVDESAQASDDAQLDESGIRRDAETGEALTGAETSDASGSVTGKEAAVTFNWGEVNPQLGGNWEAYKNALISRLGDDQNLEIKGLFSPDEENNTTFDNLGLARADQIMKLLSPPVPADRLQTTSESVTAGIEKGAAYSAVDFRTFIKKINIDESIPDRTIIRFPQNSTDRIQDPEVESYLAKVAQRIINSGESISLTGHTDRLGTYENNLELGRRRAEAIKSYLLSQGVPSSKVVVDSKGESSPIASNSTDSGRAQNRRVELQIIK